MSKYRIIGFIISKWPSSGILVTILSLIVLPSLVILSDYLYNPVLKESLLKDVYYIHGNPEITALEYSVSFVQISIFLMIIFLYPPYPAPISIEKYFKVAGYERAVIEYEFVKKILYFAVPLFIILTVLPYIDPLIRQFSSITLVQTYRESTFSVAQTVLLFVVLAGIIKMVIAVLRKKFRLYFAKGCFEIAAKKKEDTDKMSYFIKGLEAYNAYLRRNLNVQIGDIKKIISKVLGLSHEKKFTVVDAISDHFLKDTSEIYALEPLRWLQHYVVHGEIEVKDSDESLEELLTQQPTIDKIKDMSSFFAVTAIPLAISLVDLYQRFVH